MTTKAPGLAPDTQFKPPIKTTAFLFGLLSAIFMLGIIAPHRPNALQLGYTLVFVWVVAYGFMYCFLEVLTNIVKQSAPDK